MVEPKLGILWSGKLPKWWYKFSEYQLLIIFGLVEVGVSNPTRNPTNPSNPPEPEPATARTDHSDGRWRVSAPKTRHRRVEWRVFFSKTRATRSDRRYIQIWQYARRSGDIQARFGEIRRHLRRSKRNLVRSGDIRGDPGWFRRFLVQIYWVLQIPANFLKIPATFTGSGDSLHRLNRLEHHPNPKPIQPSDADSRFRFLPSFTRRRRVESGLGLKSTRPDPWTALTFAMPKHTCVISWLASNSGKMVIYAFLLGFSSPSRQKEWYEC